METEHIEKFIEDAIAGGWRDIEPLDDWHYHELVGRAAFLNKKHEYLLDPEAWKAVYGFEKVDYGNGMTKSEYQKSIDELNEDVDRTTIRKWGIEKQDRWEWYWTLFFSYLADGKSINQALEAINNSN